MITPPLPSPSPSAGCTDHAGTPDAPVDHGTPRTCSRLTNCTPDSEQAAPPQPPYAIAHRWTPVTRVCCSIVVGVDVGLTTTRSCLPSPSTSVSTDRQPSIGGYWPWPST